MGQARWVKDVDEGPEHSDYLRDVFDAERMKASRRGCILWILACVVLIALLVGSVVFKG